MRTGASRPGVFFARQGSPEGPRRGEHLGFPHPSAPLRRRARQLHQRSPHQPLPYLGAAGGQRSLALALLQHLAHQGPRRASIRLLRDKRPRHPRPGGWRRVRPVLVRVPVQEGEVEEARLPQRPPRQLPPEGEEGLGEVHPRLAVLQRKGHVPLVTQLLLGEVAHRQRQPPLAAVMPVHRAHRHAHGLGQPRGLHVVVAPLRQQPRRLAHGVGVHHLQKIHAPIPSRPSGDCSPERTFLPLPSLEEEPLRNERSFHLHLSTGRVRHRLNHAAGSRIFIREEPQASAWRAQALRRVWTPTFVVVPAFRRLKARWRSIAMFSGALSLRTRPSSTPKATSSPQYRLFSPVQCRHPAEANHGIRGHFSSPLREKAVVATETVAAPFPLRPHRRACAARAR